MKPEKQRIAIAEACGFEEVGYTGLWRRGMTFGLPDYLHDLNAMYEAEKLLRDSQIKTYTANLWQAMHLSPEAAIGTIHATASQRAEAFLRTIGKWTE